MWYHCSLSETEQLVGAMMEKKKRLIKKNSVCSVKINHILVKRVHRRIRHKIYYI